MNNIGYIQQRSKAKLLDVELRDIVKTALGKNLK